jgi:hypothetical protein
MAQLSQQITVNFETLLRQWSPRDAQPLIEAIQRKRAGRKLLCVVFNEALPLPTILAPPAILPFGKLLSRLGKLPKLDLFLRSTGGITEVPWRMVSLLREFAEELGVIVPTFALSGATHIALAADDLLLTPFSMLGSVDPTRNHPLLPKDAEGKPIPVSVQDLKHCIQFIQEQLGQSYSNQNLALIISELFKYVNPLAIGALEQSYSLSKLITRKVLQTRKTPLSEEQVGKIEELLAGKYFSHSFPISRSEVESELGLPVTKPDAELSDLISALEQFYTDEFQRVMPATPSSPEPTFRVGAFMQIATEGWAIGQFAKDNQLLADPWLELPPRQR